MFTGLLQLENSNFEGVLRRKFSALSRDAYGLAPTEELQFRRYYAQESCNRASLPPQPGFWPVKQIDGETYIAREAEDTEATNRVSGCLLQLFLCS